MKRTVLVLFLFLSFNLISYTEVFGNEEQVNAIVDEVLSSKNFPIIGTDNMRVVAPIEDELLEPHVINNTTFHLNAYESKRLDEEPIIDELLTKNFIEQVKNLPIIEKEIFDDEFFEKKVDVNRVRRIKPKDKYDFTREQVPIDIRLAEKYTHKLGKMEGDLLEFIAQHDFVIKGKRYDKGTSVWGRIETISASDKMGTPESIKIDNFFIKDDDEINLNGFVSKNGANRSYWVYPLYQAGNICFYVAGFVFVPIHGGHAKISVDEVYTVYYETQ